MTRRRRAKLPEPLDLFEGRIDSRPEDRTNRSWLSQPGQLRTVRERVPIEDGPDLGAAEWKTEMVALGRTHRVHGEPSGNRGRLGEDVFLKAQGRDPSPGSSGAGAFGRCATPSAERSRASGSALGMSRAPRPYVRNDHTQEQKTCSRLAGPSR